jgi:hypothetical protein
MKHDDMKKDESVKNDQMKQNWPLPPVFIVIPSEARDLGVG